MSPPRPRNFSLRRIGVGLALLLAGSPGWAAELAVPFKPAVLPERLALHGAGDRHGLIVSAPKDGAVLCDVTHETRFLSTDRNVLTVSTNGVVQAAGDGAAEVLVIWNDQTNRVAVTVREAATKAAPSFRQEIEPLLTRAGCNMGACHGKLAGQNGFKLSLRGYAPELDYGWLTDDVGGRRINPAFPEESLLVTKPLGTVPHEGKVRFTEGSRYHHTLVDWIAARAPGPVPMELEADANRLEILSGTGFQPVSGASSPSQEHGLEARATGKMPVPLAASRTLRPGETQQFLTRAHWPDGRIRDVTWLAQFFSNDQTVATVTPDGLVKAIRPGETAIRVHFQGLVEVVRVTIPFTNTVDGWKFTRGQNPVDAPVFAKLRALNLPPSPRCDDATFLRRAMLDTLGTLPTPDEVREFVADRSPDKRNKLVDALFDRPEFADYWTLQLADLFQNRKERDHDVRGAKNVRAFHGWLHGQVAANRPWHELVREVLTASGDAVSHPEIGYYIYLVGEKRSTESDVPDAVAQAFMGTRIGCARCHNHPLEKYTQDDFYHFAAFFDRVTLDRKGPAEGATTLLTMSREERERVQRLEEAEKKLKEAEAKLLALGYESDERPPSPRPSPPGRGRNAPAADHSTDKTALTPPTDSRANAAQSSATAVVDVAARQLASPSPGGEGRGEGGRPSISPELTKQLEAARKEFGDRQREFAGKKRELEEIRQRGPRAWQPRTKRDVKAQPLDRTAMQFTADTDPRAQLSDWLTSTNNPYFAGAMINRLWKHFLGTGLVEPVDDLRASNPPSNPELWALLSREFVGSGYDLHHVMRLILNSRTYQLSARTVRGNETDTRFYSHYYARRLPAEVIADAISAATGVPDKFDGFPVGLRAVQVPEPTVSSYFLTLFGRSERVTACACERSGDVTLPQLLHLQNGDEMNKKIQHPEGRLKALLTSAKLATDKPGLVEELYLVTVGRRPSAAETERVLTQLGEAKPEEVLPDLFWALLNTKEFAFNH
jgi:hypothetical protein